MTVASVAAFLVVGVMPAIKTLRSIRLIAESTANRIPHV